jgi:hypothetical protein
VNIARGDQVGYGHPFEFAVLCIGHDLREVVQLQLVSQNDVVWPLVRTTVVTLRLRCQVLASGAGVTYCRRQLFANAAIAASRVDS